MRLLLILGVGIVALGIMCAGCSDDNGAGPEVTAGRLTTEAWTLFEREDYLGALAKFEAAIRMDASYAEAYNGCGWSGLRLDSLAFAVSKYVEALNNDSPSADPFAGQAVANRDLDPGDFQQAVISADSALARDPDYVFTHDTTFDWKDLRLIMAQSYFHLGQYEDAKGQIDILNPQNSLDPGSATFVEDLLLEIQRLGDQLTP